MKQVTGKEPLLDVAMELEKIALSDESLYLVLQPTLMQALLGTLQSGNFELKRSGTYDSGWVVHVCIRKLRIHEIF